MSELGVGDFQFLKSGSDEPCIQPIESSHLAVAPASAAVAALARAAFGLAPAVLAARRARLRGGALCLGARFGARRRRGAR
ncbi:hypothetical protein FO357_08995 [Bordetella pertussis]